MNHIHFFLIFMKQISPINRIFEGPASQRQKKKKEEEEASGFKSAKHYTLCIVSVI